MANKKFIKRSIEISFVTVDHTVKHLPTQMVDDASIYMLYSQTKHYINPGTCKSIPTGFRMSMPDIVENITVEGSTTRVSQSTLLATIHTSNYLAESKGIIVLAPTILPPSHQSEIILYCMNLTKDVQVIHPGDELALMGFNITPRVQMKLIPNTILKGKPYVL